MIKNKIVCYQITTWGLTTKMFNKCVVWTIKLYCMACFHSRKTDNLDKGDWHELRFPRCLKFLYLWCLQIWPIICFRPPSTFVYLHNYQKLCNLCKIFNLRNCATRWYITLTIASTIDNTWAWHVGHIRVSNCIWN